METGIFWPAWWGAVGLRRAASGPVRAGRRIRLWRAAVRRHRVVTSLPASAAGASPEAGAPHRVRLEGTTWGVWRDMCLRSAGFPADMVLAICDEALARSADLAGADPAGRLAYDQVYADAAGRLARALAGIYAGPVFREAITWQNPGLAQFLHDHDAGPGAARRGAASSRSPSPTPSCGSCWRVMAAARSARYWTAPEHPMPAAC